VALGPIYETTLKAMRYPPQGLDRIGEWKGLVSCPLVAIGGITLERSSEVLAAGADSIAVVTDIVKHPEPERRVREWLAASTVRK
jgi:thiamine-phosphate pyrophosphorylase